MGAGVPRLDQSPAAQAPLPLALLRLPLHPMLQPQQPAGYPSTFPK